MLKLLIIFIVEAASTLHPKEVIGLIVANKDYSILKENGYDDVNFAKEEIDMVLPLFKKFCTTDVTVLIEPNSDALDSYFAEVANIKAFKLRDPKDGKAGCTLLFYSVGHGVVDKL